jgi:hypothetical protein
MPASFIGILKFNLRYFSKFFKKSVPAENPARKTAPPFDRVDRLFRRPFDIQDHH